MRKINCIVCAIKFYDYLCFTRVQFLTVTASDIILSVVINAMPNSVQISSTGVGQEITAFGGGARLLQQQRIRCYFSLFSPVLF